jgi:hypothetical protein
VAGQVHNRGCQEISDRLGSCSFSSPQAGLGQDPAALDASAEHDLFKRYASSAGQAGQEDGGITVLISHASPPCAWPTSSHVYNGAAKDISRKAADEIEDCRGAPTSRR